MSHKKCCVPNCDKSRKSRPEIRLHKFPNPCKEPERFHTWLYAVGALGGDVLALENDAVFKNRRICYRHFLPQYKSSRRLTTTAIPTLHLADVATVAPACRAQLDVPLSVKEEPGDGLTGDTAVEQNVADPYHSALGLHTECDIPLDVVKEEPDDVDTGMNIHSEQDHCSPRPAEETLRADIVHRQGVTTYDNQHPRLGESQATRKEPLRSNKAPRTYRARGALLKQQNKLGEKVRDSGASALEKRRWRERTEGAREAAARRMAHYRQGNTANNCSRHHEVHSELRKSTRATMESLGYIVVEMDLSNEPDNYQDKFKKLW